MRKVMVSLLVGVLGLAGCSTATEPGDGPTPEPSYSPAVEGSVAPLNASPELEAIGFSSATMSVETANGAWVEDDTGLTYLEPWEREDPGVTIVRVGLDGEERWRDTVSLPQSDSTLYPRLSEDEGLGIVGLWFSTSSSSGTRDFAGDISWFVNETGERQELSVERGDGSRIVASWADIVGYVSGPTENGAANEAFTYIGAGLEPVTTQWDSVLRSSQESWLGAVVAGQPSYTVFRSGDPEDRTALRYGSNVILGGSSSDMRWVTTSSGTHGVVGTPGSGLIVVDARGDVLLDYAGECSTSSSSVVGLGSQLWSSATHFDAATGEVTCLRGFDDEGVTLMGITPSGIALGQTYSGTVAFSEPQYTTTVESDVEGAAWPRGNYVLVQTTSEDGNDLISAFNEADLTVR